VLGEGGYATSGVRDDGVPELLESAHVVALDPIGCLVPIAAAVVMMVGVGVVIGSRLGQTSGPNSVTVRVLDDGARSGPAVISTQVVPLR